jgi:hypothetical protein
MRRQGGPTASQASGKTRIKKRQNWFSHEGYLTEFERVAWEPIFER